MSEIQLSADDLDALLNGDEVEVDGIAILPPNNEVSVMLSFSVPPREDLAAATKAIRGNLNTALEVCPYTYEMVVE